MNWYTATLVYEIDSGSVQPQYDVQLRLIQANNSTKAYEEARRIGAFEEEQISGENGRKIHWRFSGVIDITAIILDHGSVIQQSGSLPDGWDPHLLRQHIQEKEQTWQTHSAILRTFNHQAPLLM